MKQIMKRKGKSKDESKVRRIQVGGRGGGGIVLVAVMFGKGKKNWGEERQRMRRWKTSTGRRKNNE